MENEMQRVEQNAESLMIDLQTVLRGLEDCAEMSRDFLSVSTEWECCRKNTIKMLDDIALELDKHHHNINVAKITGGVVSILSVIAALVGGSGHSLNSNLLRYLLTGSAVVGGLTTAGSSVVEAGLAKNLFQKAQVLLTEDTQISETLCNWFKRSGNLMEEIEKICSFDIFKDIFIRCICTLSEISDSADNFFDIVQSRIVEVLTKRGASKTDIGKISAMFEIIYHSQELFTIMKQISEVLRLNPHTLEAVQLAVGFRWISSKGLSRTGDIVRMLSSLFGKTVADDTVHKAVAFGLFGALKLALDIIALTLTSSDIHKGSVSEYGNMIRKVNFLLESELKCVNEMQLKLREQTGVHSY